MSDADYVPHWQEDSGSIKCGRLVCATCSDQAVRYFPRTVIANPSDTVIYSSQAEIYKTCDECVEEIRMIRRALFDSNIVGEHAENRSWSSSASEGNASASGTMSVPADDRNSVMKFSRTRTSTRVLDSSTNSSTNNLASSRDDDSDHNLCPVCAINMLDAYITTHKKKINEISNDDFETFKEDHIKSCLTSFDFDYSHSRFAGGASGSNHTHPRNKMLVYNMPPIPKPQFEAIPAVEGTSYDTIKQMSGYDEGLHLRIGSVTSISTVQQNEKEDPDDDDNECVICLEELKPGDKVGRLECLCVFHYKCIKDWFNKKGYGECPVHYLSK
ncbi:hypothetical protein PSN45_003133 [Yamadazyma tenuis]|uniref:uncharacterized protein n=1 Tax=Candida tenuis TaxID=2315449 RepID=UPI0027A7C8EC|nr:hypothetical protein PSN45_003133 [Yamadazyma tenuis]